MNADNRLCGIAPYIDTTAPSLRRGTNRICAVCGEPVAHVNHAIFGGSPTFHGFVDSGQRVSVVSRAPHYPERPPEWSGYDRETIINERTDR